MGAGRGDHSAASSTNSDLAQLREGQPKASSYLERDRAGKGSEMASMEKVYEEVACLGRGEGSDAEGWA